MNALLYRIECELGLQWYPVPVRLDGAHNFAKRTEWHRELETAVEYAGRKVAEDAARYQHESHRRAMFRVVDHLGKVHWSEGK